MAYRKGTLKDLEAYNTRKGTDKHLYEVRIAYFRDSFFPTDSVEYGGSNSLEEARELFKQAEIEATKTIKKKSTKLNEYTVELKEYRIDNYWGDGWFNLDKHIGKNKRTEEPTQEREL